MSFSNMKSSSPPCSNINTKKIKLDRKTVEKNRRIEMKGLRVSLTSLIPYNYFNSTKKLLSQQDQLDQAAIYIKQLKDRVDELKTRKEAAAASISTNGTHKAGLAGNKNDNTSTYITKNVVGSFKNVGIPPVIELREFDSNLDVVLISQAKLKNMLYKVMALLQDEGTDVLSLSFSTAGDRVFMTLNTRIKISRVGVDTSSIRQKLEEILTQEE